MYIWCTSLWPGVSQYVSDDDEYILGADAFDQVCHNTFQILMSVHQVCHNMFQMLMSVHWVQAPVIRCVMICFRCWWMYIGYRLLWSVVSWYVSDVDECTLGTGTCDQVCHDMFQMLMSVHWVHTPVTRCVIIPKGITRVVVTRATPLMQVVGSAMVGIHHPKLYTPGVGVTKPIFSVPLFSQFFRMVKTLIICMISRWYLTGVTAAELRRHLTNMNVIENI